MYVYNMHAFEAHFFELLNLFYVKKQWEKWKGKKKILWPVEPYHLEWLESTSYRRFFFSFTTFITCLCKIIICHKKKMCTLKMCTLFSNIQFKKQVKKILKSYFLSVSLYVVTCLACIQLQEGSCFHTHKHTHTHVCTYIHTANTVQALPRYAVITAYILCIKLQRLYRASSASSSQLSYSMVPQ